MTRGATKLTAEQAAEIYRLICAGETQQAIATRFGIHRTTVSHIKRGYNWVKVTKQKPTRSKAQNIDWPPLLQAAVAEGWCIKKVAQKAKCSPNSVRVACAKAGIRIARPYERHTDFAARMQARAGA